jgi:hypothetical protein
MTWTKTGAEFPDDAFNVELSDAAYRTHHEAITYLYKIERTDCYIRTDEVRRFAGSPHAEMAVTDLVNIGWWRVKGQGYEVIHHAEVIRASIVFQQKKRATSRKTSKTYRSSEAAKKKAADSAEVTPDVTDDVTRHADRQTDKQLEGDEKQQGWPTRVVPS